MSWLDLVLAVPGVGLRMKPSLKRSIDNVRVISPLVDELAKETGDAEYIIGQPPAVQIKTLNGFSIGMTLDTVSVEYSYPVGQKRTTGKLLTIDPPKQETYSDLLAKTLTMLNRVARCFGEANALPVNRIGFIASVRVARSGMPPGISSFIQQLESPWGSPLVRTSCHLVGKLAEGKGYSDQCHHVLTADSTIEGRGDEIELKLDWQRTFDPEIPSRPTELEQKVLDCQKPALAYFEKVGKDGVGRV